MTISRSLRISAFVFALAACLAVPLRASEITSADLEIRGLMLTIASENIAIETAVDMPSVVQTEFGGKRNEEVRGGEGLRVTAELTGSGLDRPLTLFTSPGGAIRVPPLTAGNYELQNIRLVDFEGRFLQMSSPPTVAVTVRNAFATHVSVKQLTADEIRKLGISLDARNYDVYQYTFTFVFDGQSVEIPFPVIVDPRTHEITPLVSGNPYVLPPKSPIVPPRWSPPTTLPLELVPDESGMPGVPTPPPGESSAPHPRIPAAIVIPNNLAVLHQFFTVVMMVTNEASETSAVRLDSVTATMKSPSGLRVVHVSPATAIGQPLPILDSRTHVSFLVAKSEGEAEWTMEGLQPGTHTGLIEVKATYQSPGQTDFALKGTAPFSIVVHDPRFNITFCHPDSVRRGLEYKTVSFITNTSDSIQSLVVNTNEIPECAAGGIYSNHVCRAVGSPSTFEIKDLRSGETRAISYSLQSDIDGHVIATAGSVDGVTASVQMTMGVSATGIPLSPATLVMPYYAQFMGSDLVDAELQLLGLGYSLATAPVTDATARFPRVIQSDVFERALDLSRAGQRRFIGQPDSDNFANLVLDSLGNRRELAEWDALRRQEPSGRAVASALSAEIERTVLRTPADFETFLPGFARTTAWRQESAGGANYFAALVHADTTVATPFAVAVREIVTNRTMIGPSDASDGWFLPYGDIFSLRPSDAATHGLHAGALAIVGRWSDSLELDVTPSYTGAAKIDLVIPGIGSEHRFAHVELNVIAGRTIRVRVDRNQQTLTFECPNGDVTSVSSRVTEPPLSLVAARQDLHLDAEGHQVSILFNRPVSIPAGTELTDISNFVTAIHVAEAAYEGRRRIFAAALQEGAQVLNVSYEHALSKNASYEAAIIAPLVDPLSGSPTSIERTVGITVDNDMPAGILFGHVLEADGSPVAQAEVSLYAGRYVGCDVQRIEALQTSDCNPFDGAPQYEGSRELTGNTNLDGSFLFEYVPRDLQEGYSGQYRLRATKSNGTSTALDGAVHLTAGVTAVDVVFLGRGSAEGVVRYDDGTRVAGARIVVGSTMFNQSQTALTDADGRFAVSDLPVGPLTFSATDSKGLMAFAANQLRQSGEIVLQDITIFRQQRTGSGSVRGVVLRSDRNAASPDAAVAGSRVGIFSQGYQVAETFTDARGSFAFEDVPAGFVTVLAANWSISQQSAAQDFNLDRDELRDVSLVLNVAPAESLVSLRGKVTRANPSDPAHPFDVDGALIAIQNGPATTSSADGTFSFASLPASFADRLVRAYDASTQRAVDAAIPTLSAAAPNYMELRIPSESYGTGTVRVQVLDAAGFRVAQGTHVFEPGYPPSSFESATEPGVFELKDAVVGRIYSVWAVGPGEQSAHGTVTVRYPGEISLLTLRLSGEGTVRVRLRGDVDMVGDVTLSYSAWSDADQSLSLKSVTKSTSQDGSTAGEAIFTGVPALASFTVASSSSNFGSASVQARLTYDGETRSITLQLSKLATIHGTVLGIDGATPVAGVTLRLNDGVQDRGTTTSNADGTFIFQNVPGDSSFRLVATTTQYGIYRTGFAEGRTPLLGGALDGIDVVLRMQASVVGRIVYAGYQVFDPANPANNVLDTTPNDLSDNAPVPFARLYARELGFPAREFGDGLDPLTADSAGRFTVANIFEGSIRIAVWDPRNEERRGDWTGEISSEGVNLEPIIAVGSAGFGDVTAVVRDPNESNRAVANAEVGLYVAAGSIFDFTTTDSNGAATFHEIPAGNYRVAAYSKAVARGGASNVFQVLDRLGASVDVPLQFSGRVTGRLIDEEASNAGVVGAPVTLSASNYQTRATTADAGTFLFEGVREGVFTLDAKDTRTNRHATARREMTQELGEVAVGLSLEPTQSLVVGVYVPDDAGHASSILVPYVQLEIRQRCSSAGCDFLRTVQSNQTAPIVVPGLLKNEPYSLVVRELGGEGRTLAVNGSFPDGSPDHPLQLVLLASGTVEVHVLDPIAGARVTVYGSRGSATAYTDAAGIATAPHIGLGDGIVEVTSSLGQASATFRLQSQSIPLVVPVTIVNNMMTVTGLVDAEAGGASVGTLVEATTGSATREARTDADGRFSFVGIPAGTVVTLSYLGPDDKTLAASDAYTILLTETRTYEVPRIRLDATPPRILAIEPSDGALNVSPDSVIGVAFSEAIDSRFLTANNFQLVDSSTGRALNATVTQALAADGTSNITITPPPAQPYALGSNTLYHFVVSGSITDLAGHPIPSARGSNFITSDYAEPRVIRVEPSDRLPLPSDATLRFVFNERINPAGATDVHFWKVSALGARDGIEKSGNAYVDATTGTTLVFAPSDAIEEQSYYRVVFSGVRDLQGNQSAPAEYFFFSYDRTGPAIVINAPEPSAILVAGNIYTATVQSAATDIDRIDWFEVDGSNTTFKRSATSSPFGYPFAASLAGASLTLKAVATDLSGNTSNEAIATWQVQANKPPQNVVVSLDHSSGAYPGTRVVANVSFDDEELQATVTLLVTGEQATGSAYSTSQSRQVIRATTADPWPVSSFTFDLPATLKQGSSVTLAATVTDYHQQQSTSSASLALLADQIAPVIVSLSPAAETRLENGQTYTIEADVRDLESGAAGVDIEVGGQRVPVATRTAVADAGTWKFVSSAVTVPAKNIDTRIPIDITAHDFNGNTVHQSVDVIYGGVNNADAPKVSWACPLDKALLPAGESSLTLTLRVAATDPNNDITRVEFLLPGSTTPIAASLEGNSYYAATGTIATPPPGATMTFTAIVNDLDPTHEVRLPIYVTTATPDISIINRTQAILPADATNYAGKTVLVRGASAKLVPQAPLSLRSLMVLDGARVETLGTTTTKEERLDLTIADTLYVDCASTIDVSGRGYLGGYGKGPDLVQNLDERGMTIGLTKIGGATRGISATHAGLAGNTLGTTNRAYGALRNPSDLGSGGGGYNNSGTWYPGASGGGAARMFSNYGRVVISGSIRADGGTGFDPWISGAGAGGSVLVFAPTVITGPASRITANGGDDQGSFTGSGGGGGRIAIRSMARLDLAHPMTVCEARGGRNVSDVEEGILDAGAGTIYVERPGSVVGDLYISSFDSRYPSTAHLTRPAIVGQVGRGISTSATSTSLTDFTREFDSSVIGERIVLANDATRSLAVIGISPDRHTLITDPADGDLLALAGGQAVDYSGLISLGSITLGPRALLRADDHLMIAGVLDSRNGVVADDGAVSVLFADRPTLALITTPVADSNLPIGTSLSFSYTANALPGLAKMSELWANEQRDYNAGFQPTFKNAGSLSTSSVPLGTAIFKIRAVDRADRIIETSASFTVTSTAGAGVATKAIEPPNVVAIDAPVPIVSFAYPNSGARYRAGCLAKVRVNVLNGFGFGGTEILRVRISAGGAATEATLLPGSYSTYEASVPIAPHPGAATVDVVAVATSVKGFSVSSSINIGIANGQGCQERDR